MKLATYRDGSRDGQLVVVSRDLQSAHYASGAATRLQQVLDDWNFISPQLEELARGLEQGRLPHAFRFDPSQCMAPLPRAYQRAALEAGSAPPEEPRLVQWPGDALSGPRAALEVLATETGIDFGVSLVAAIGDVALGSEAPATLEAVRLLLLACDFVERGDADAADGAPLLATAFAPVALTPDELAGAWRAGRAHLVVECWRDARRVGRLDTGAMPFGFGEPIAALASHRRLGAGSLVGGAALDGPADGSSGYGSIAERHRQESLGGSAERTRWLRAGDAALRIDGGGFGSIEPELVHRG